MSWYYLFLFWPVIGWIILIIGVFQRSSVIYLGEVFAVFFGGICLGPIACCFLEIDWPTIIVWRQKK